MATLSITNAWPNGAVLDEADIDQIKNALETFLNTTKLSADNIAAGVVTPALLASGAITKAKLAAVGQQLSSSTSTFTTTSTSFTDVTNASVSITTTGRPVVLLLQSDGSVSQVSYGATTSGTRSAVAYFKILRDTTEIAHIEDSVTTMELGTNSFDVPSGGAYHIDTPAAGTYTYKLQIKMEASATGNVTALKLVAFET